MIEEFQLKRFLNDGAARTASGGLSGSYSETWSTAELLALEDGASEAYLNLPLTYPQMNGHEALRALVAARHGARGPEDVIVTSGVDDALSLFVLASVNAGDHVIVQTPAYQPLVSLPRWRGAEVSEWPCREEHGWAPSLDELARLLRPTTRLVMLVSPHNPTGWTADEAFLRAVLDLTAGSGARVLCDEMYRGIPLTDRAEAPSVASLASHGVAVGGVAKGFGLPGLRIGWVVCRDERLTAGLKRTRLHLNTFVSAPSEFLASLALRHAQGLLDRNRQIALENLQLARDFSARHPGLLSVTWPEFGVVGFPKWEGPGTAEDLGQALLRETGVLLVPGKYFQAGARHFRLGFGTRAFRRDFAKFADFVSSLAGDHLG